MSVSAGFLVLEISKERISIQYVAPTIALAAPTGYTRRRES
jgi:hypothetical protein